MTDLVEQQSNGSKKDKVSLTLWLDPSVVENLNELVIRKSNRKTITSKSDVVAELVNAAHRKGAR